MFICFVVSGNKWRLVLWAPPVGGEGEGCSVAWINDPADPTDKPRADLSVADLAVTNLLDA